MQTRIKGPRTGHNNGKKPKGGQAVSNKQKSKGQGRKSTLQRLAWANVVAALALLTVTVVMLHALGLLESILLFFF